MGSEVNLRLKDEVLQGLDNGQTDHNDTNEALGENI